MDAGHREPYTARERVELLSSTWYVVPAHRGSHLPLCGLLILCAQVSEIPQPSPAPADLNSRVSSAEFAT